MRLPDTQVIANILGYMYSNIFPNRFKRLYKCTLPSSVYIHEKLETIGSVSKDFTSKHHFRHTEELSG